MIPLAGNAKSLAEIGRAKEKEVDSWYFANSLDNLDGIHMFDLDADDRIFVCFTKVVENRKCAIPTIDTRAIDAATTSRVKARPVNNVANFLDRANHGGHEATATSFKDSHQRAVVGGRKANKIVEARGTTGPGQFLDLSNAETSMFLVEPDGIELVRESDNLQELGGAELSESKNTKESAGCESLFETCQEGALPEKKLLKWLAGTRDRTLVEAV